MSFVSKFQHYAMLDNDVSRTLSSFYQLFYCANVQNPGYFLDLIELHNKKG